MITFFTINIILLVIYIIILIVKSYCCNYGNIEIIINKNEKVIKTEGGKTLLSLLNDNNYKIPSACGGKGICGYCKCKIDNGAPPSLPTEDLFLSKEERLQNIRLSCQVKIKNNMEITIPDFFDNVKEIVKNKTYDPDIRWEVSVNNKFESLFEKNNKNKNLSNNDYESIKNIMAKYNYDSTKLLPILHEINNEFNYFSENIIKEISKELSIPISKTIKILTSYHAFHTYPKGKNIIQVCNGISCYLKGSNNIIKEFSNIIGISPNMTTKDSKFSLQTVRCLGCCSSSPAIMINEKIYGNVKTSDIEKIIKDYL